MGKKRNAALQATRGKYMLLPYFMFCFVGGRGGRRLALNIAELRRANAQQESGSDEPSDDNSVIQQVAQPIPG
jgi:hypothetical protein